MCHPIARRDRACWEDQHVELRVQVARVECLWIDDLEWKFISLEQPAQPAAFDRTAITIPETDPKGAQTSPARRYRRNRGEPQSKIRRRLPQNRRGCRIRWDVERIAQRLHRDTGGQQSIHHDERIVLLPA